MDLIYLDYNCFQRGFDDPRQTRIQMEALACQELFIMAEVGTIKLIWSFMHLDETNLCPFPDRKYAIFGIASLCQVRLGPTEDILELAKSFQATANLSSKDALHLACAVEVKADLFLTCDDDLRKKGQNLNLTIELLNPINYITKEVN
ncbi:MAG: type II toxin-antitoxin system VapC family toxin [Trichodesmium sp.]